jgi:membrane fusion protein, peptide pheromone/bacteriocin exporter
VLIRPAAAHLVLPNGVRGELKQGLTLTARYVVARRSLLQILYEDASAWLNPQENLGSLSTGHP